MRITLRSLSYSVGIRELLRELTHTFHAGESISISGPSGSGKSTLLGIIAGRIPPTGGSISLESATKRDVDWIVQSAPLLNKRTVLDNARLAAGIRGSPLTETRTTAAQALARLGIDSLADRMAGSLSGGEQQRVAVARALCSGARILLADEPTASLDSVNRDSITAALIAEAAAGKIVCIATHDQAVARACQRSLILSNGALTEVTR